MFNQNFINGDFTKKIKFHPTCKSLKKRRKVSLEVAYDDPWFLKIADQKSLDAIHKELLGVEFVPVGECKSHYEKRSLQIYLLEHTIKKEKLDDSLEIFLKRTRKGALKRGVKKAYVNKGIKVIRNTMQDRIVDFNKMGISIALSCRALGNVSRDDSDMNWYEAWEAAGMLQRSGFVKKFVSYEQQKTNPDAKHPKGKCTIFTFYAEPQGKDFRLDPKTRVPSGYDEFMKNLQETFESLSDMLAEAITEKELKDALNEMNRFLSDVKAKIYSGVKDINNTWVGRLSIPIPI